MESPKLERLTALGRYSATREFVVRGQTVTLGHVDSLLCCSSGGQKEASALCRSASEPAARRGGQRSISKILTLLRKWTTIYERMRFAQQDMERTTARHQNDIGVL